MIVYLRDLDVDIISHAFRLRVAFLFYYTFADIEKLLVTLKDALDHA